MNETDYYARDWMGVEWSPWYDHYESWKEYDVESGKLDYVPDEPGVYRIRHESGVLDGLTYIGQSGDLHRRLITQLAGAMYVSESSRLRPEMPYKVPHAAGPCLWAICDSYGTKLEISFTSSDNLQDKQIRETFEDAVTAAYRREIGESPMANFARMLVGYKQSTYKNVDKPYRGGKLSSNETEPKSELGVGPVPWTNSKDVTSDDWMGLDWSDPLPLSKRKDVSAPEAGVYRIWYEGNTPPLAYIGESSNLASRFYTHEKNYGSDAIFSFVERTDLDAQHKRREIETDLIGGHYLMTREPPMAQFGKKNRVPPE
ncbi:GIY-YIG nuclease family protein [Halobium palmae]|uniref:GIY-YIG nuclease family protein n=1 Tax=Halobium palmae TaxID=1776492 RepID=A0ABD5RWX1_9EURY